MSKRIMRGSAGVAAALLTVLLAGCNDSETPTTTPATSSSSTSSPSSSSASSSAPSSTQPAKTDEAAQAVEDFYKQMDQYGANKLHPDDVSTWTLIDSDGSDTQNKWTLMVEKQIFASKVAQVGDTVVSEVTAEEVEKPKSKVKFDAAYEVIACVDRSGLTYISTESGKPKEYKQGAASKTWVTHLVVELKGNFRVARDTPGKSC